MYARDRPFHAPRRKTPSFSSSLLEAIYQSIDESEGQDECSSFYGEGFGASIGKQSLRGSYDCNSSSVPCSAGRRGGFTSLERVMMIEEWMEKQGSRNRCGSMRINSGSSSSDSSSAGRTGAYSFSSSETESGRCKHRSSRQRFSTNDDGGRENTKKKDRNDSLGGGISRTKLGALKIYGELKKVKQPISPGGKISSFLNSIFNSGNVKKAKMCYVGAADDVSKATTLSSSVSFDSKPCMSKMLTTRKLSADDSNTAKRTQRSVRFYPTEVVPGDDNPEPFDYRTVLGSCPSYKEKKRTSGLANTTKTENKWFGDRVRAHEDEEHDGMSCSSSDLFELGDHLIGGRYGEELPVYESTSFKRNQAIAHGFIF